MNKQKQNKRSLNVIKLRVDPLLLEDSAPV